MQKKLYKSCYQPVNAGGYKQPHMHTTQEDFKDGWWSQPKAPLTDGQGRKRSKPRNRGCVCVCVCRNIPGMPIYQVSNRNGFG